MFQTETSVVGDVVYILCQFFDKSIFSINSDDFHRNRYVMGSNICWYYWKYGRQNIFVCIIMII